MSTYFLFLYSRDKIFGDWHVNRQGAANCSVRFPVLNPAGDGDVEEIEMARETEMVREREKEMVREMRGGGDNEGEGDGDVRERETEMVREMRGDGGN